jgi:hypothetical protein
MDRVGGSVPLKSRLAVKDEVRIAIARLPFFHDIKPGTNPVFLGGGDGWPNQKRALSHSRDDQGR